MHAVPDVLILVYDNIHEKKYSGLIFLDIQKAFDTVDHIIYWLQSLNIMISEALLKICLNPTYKIDSNLLLWMTIQDYMKHVLVKVDKSHFAVSRKLRLKF